MSRNLLGTGIRPVALIWGGNLTDQFSMLHLRRIKVNSSPQVRLWISLIVAQVLEPDHQARDLNVIYICGPGHGGPAMVAHAYLEGTYTEVYPSIRQDAEGMRRLFRQFSFPCGIPSHAAPETPGSIHEGGELGYALAHAYGAAFDNPDLIVGSGSHTSGNNGAETALAG